MKSFKDILKEVKDFSFYKALKRYPPKTAIFHEPTAYKRKQGSPIEPKGMFTTTRDPESMEWGEMNFTASHPKTGLGFVDHRRIRDQLTGHLDQLYRNIGFKPDKKGMTNLRARGAYLGYDANSYPHSQLIRGNVGHSFHREAMIGLAVEEYFSALQNKLQKIADNHDSIAMHGDGSVTMRGNKAVPTIRRIHPITGDADSGFHHIIKLQLPPHMTRTPEAHRTNHEEKQKWHKKMSGILSTKTGMLYRPIEDNAVGNYSVQFYTSAYHPDAIKPDDSDDGGGDKKVPTKPKTPQLVFEDTELKESLKKKMQAILGAGAIAVSGTFAVHNYMGHLKATKPVIAPIQNQVPPIVSATPPKPKEKSSEKIPAHFQNENIRKFYAGVVNAEHRGEAKRLGLSQDPFQHHKDIYVRNKWVSSSSAYGPAQLTYSAVKDHVKRHPDLFTGQEQYISSFIDQGKAMINSDKDHPTHGLGKAGDLSSPEHHENYQRLATSVIHSMARDRKIDLSKPLSDEHLNSLTQAWRGRPKEKDKQYFETHNSTFKDTK